MNLEGKQALVTGGAVRIGRAIVKRLAEYKCDVIIHYHNSETEALKLAEEVRGLGRKAYTVEGNLNSNDGCLRVIDDSINKAGRIDILVNNAAVFIRKPFHETTDASIKYEFQVNLFSPMSLTREFSNHIVFSKREEAVSGAVVNLVDRRVSGNPVGCFSYLLTKKSLVDFTRNVALELAPLIAVNAIAPGAILPPPDDDDSGVKVLAGKIPLQYQCRPKDIAKGVIFLLQSDGITGQTLFIDSGQHLIDNLDS